MDNKDFFRVVLALAVIVVLGVFTWRVTDKMTERTLNLLLGGGSVLGIVLLVGVLFIAKDAIQAYTMRRFVADDDYRDIKQLAMVSRLMGKSNVNVKLPQQDQRGPWAVLPQGIQEQGQQRPAFDGEFRDTTGVELE